MVDKSLFLTRRRFVKVLAGSIAALSGGAAVFGPKALSTVLSPQLMYNYRASAAVEVVVINNIIPPTMITREALALLENKLIFHG